MRLTRQLRVRANLVFFACLVAASTVVACTTRSTVLPSLPGYSVASSRPIVPQGQVFACTSQEYSQITHNYPGDVGNPV
jgi:hypothetical protein